MADALGRAGERALTYGASGALIGSAIPVIGTALGAGIGAGVGALSGWFSANQENQQLEAAKVEAENAITKATNELQTANEENRQYLSEVIIRARENLAKITDRQRQLAEEISKQQQGLASETARIQQDSLNQQQGALDTAQLKRLEALGERERLGLSGYEALQNALTTQQTVELGGLTSQQQILKDIEARQQQGIAAREALTADEEAAARRITAPGGLLERQRQQNALAQAKAMQRARVGGPAARAAIMGQFATQGADLGMQAQRDIMAAQDRARQARAGLLGERTAASVARLQGMSGLTSQRAAIQSRIAGARGETTFRQKEFEGGLAVDRGGIEAQRQQQYAEFLNKYYGVDIEKAKQMAQAQMDRAKQLAQADIDFTQGLGKIDQSEFEAATGMRSRLGDMYAQYERDIGDVGMATRARGLELQREESARNAGLLQSAIPVAGQLASGMTKPSSYNTSMSSVSLGSKAGMPVNPYETRYSGTGNSGLSGYGRLA